MKYEKEIRLKDGRTCLLRSGTAADGQAVLENFNQAHGETDYLLSYPDENSFNARQESEFLEKMLCSETGAELLAIVEGRLQTRDWTDKDGNKRVATEVVAENVYFGDSKRDGAGDYGAAPAYSAPSRPAAAPMSGHSDFAEIGEEDGELPF